MQGLLESTKSVEGNIDYISKGEIVKVKSNDIFSNLIKSDLIFMNDSNFFHNFFNEKKLWKKTIFYDYRDNVKLVNTIPNNVPYFKRSLYNGNQRIPELHLRKVYPISHCALAEYFVNSLEKPYDIGCFFDFKNINLGIRRKNILSRLKDANFDNSLIGESTAFANKARLAIRDKESGNPFYEFLNIQSQCKIIFTAQPELVEGDNRTWEALASGALVFCEKPLDLTPELVDGVHCIYFDSMNENSINESIEKAKYYLEHRDERLKIANNGLNFIKKHHTPFNRIKTMMLKKSISL